MADHPLCVMLGRAGVAGPNNFPGRFTGARVRTYTKRCGRSGAKRSLADTCQGQKEYTALRRPQFVRGGSTSVVCPTRA